MTGADPADLLLSSQPLCGIPRRVLKAFQRMETGFLMQFEFSNQTTAIHVINVTGVFTCGNHASPLFEFAEGRHPDPVIFFPERLIGGAPLQKIGSMMCRIGLEIIT